MYKSCRVFVCLESCISSSGNNLAFKSLILKFLFHLCAFLFSLFSPREMHLFIVSEDAHLTLRNLLHNQFSAISENIVSFQILNAAK